MGDLSVLLIASAFVLGVVHTLAGPDHYIPFLALSRTRRWSLPRTLLITASCGLGHVAGSILIVPLALALGLSLDAVRLTEAFRGNVAGWLLLGFGIAYLAWGIRQALRHGSVHEHSHVHPEDGEGALPHCHLHDHAAGHVHAHIQDRKSLTPWLLFLVLVFGPCEPMIPLVFLPAATGNIGQAVLVAIVFSSATVLTMLAVVGMASAGLARISSVFLERYGHALAGGLVTLCGIAVKLGL
jgi:ABC-type nickel/cobalt efflux system permease component RcnA